MKPNTSNTRIDGLQATPDKSNPSNTVQQEWAVEKNHIVDKNLPGNIIASFNIGSGDEWKESVKLAASAPQLQEEVKALKADSEKWEKAFKITAADLDDCRKFHNEWLLRTSEHNEALKAREKELREALQELYITHYEDTNAFRSEQVTALKNAKETLQKQLP